MPRKDVVKPGLPVAGFTTSVMITQSELLKNSLFWRIWSIRENDPDYVATYYQLAKTLERAGRADDAAETYRVGITVATRVGDNHTREELTTALESLTEA